jgi:hypothetical protein
MEENKHNFVGNMGEVTIMVHAFACKISKEISCTGRATNRMCFKCDERTLSQKLSSVFHTRRNILEFLCDCQLFRKRPIPWTRSMYPCNQHSCVCIFHYHFIIQFSTTFTSSVFSHLHQSSEILNPSAINSAADRLLNILQIFGLFML